MKHLHPQYQDPNLILDCSQPDQINFWAETFQVSPQAIKTAVRACCNNSIACISAYLQNVYIPSMQQNQSQNSQAKAPQQKQCIRGFVKSLNN